MDEAKDIFTEMYGAWQMVPPDDLASFQVSIDIIAELYPLHSNDLDKLAYLHMVEKLIVMRATSLQES